MVSDSVRQSMTVPRTYFGVAAKICALTLSSTARSNVDRNLSRARWLD
jgi:hypothetical protein